MIQHSASRNEVELDRHLLHNADRLRRYLTPKIPPGLRGQVSADDVLQDVWLAAFKGVADFQAQGQDCFDRWLTRLAQRKLTDACRRARSSKRGGKAATLRNADGRLSSFGALWDRVTSPERTPSRAVSAKEAAQAVLAALGTLPQPHRRAMRLCYIEGRSIAETARAMAKTPAAVNSLLFRGRRHLRKRLGRAGKYFSDSGETDGPVQ
ncbi:MAG: RNA polymerase sigma factor [Planctomycetota bacterium]|jgi:RNA polymerase sigma-70 factor (ECF subfamily)